MGSWDCRRPNNYETKRKEYSVKIYSHYSSVFAFAVVSQMNFHTKYFLCSMERVDSSERRCTPTKCRSCCKSFAAFLFSTLGLVIMVAAYSVLGGMLFQKIEQQLENDTIKDARILVKEHTDRRVAQLWDMTDRLNVLHRENWTIEATQILTQYQVKHSQV